MKKTSWLGTAAAVAAVGVVVYTQFSGGDPPLPKVPLTAEAAPAEVPQLALPPVVLPPEETLAISDVPPMSAVPPPPAGSETILPPPLTLVSATEPGAPLPPTLPVPTEPTLPVIPGMEPVVPTAPVPTLPTMPALPPPVTFDPVPPILMSEGPATPVKPELPIPLASPPIAPVPPAASIPSVPTMPLLPPTLPTPVLTPPAPVLQPAPLPPGASEKVPVALAVAGRYVVLKDNKMVEGGVTLEGENVFVRQGSLERKFPKNQVQFVAGSKDEVYRFMAAKVSATNAVARLQVARWCMFSGMREQALAEAREVEKLHPNDLDGVRARKAAVDLARSLELSLQQFPTEAAAKMAAPAVPTVPAELVPARPVSPATPEAEPDVSPEAALVFGARVQPFLANQCMECHAKPDFAGKFKLVRVNPADAGPQATRTNLKAVAGQLRKDDPGASPLLWKTLTAHGEMKRPAVMNRQAVAYQSLEAWTALAVGTPLAVPPAPVPAPPVLPATDSVLPPPLAPALVPLPVPPPAVDPQMPLPPAVPVPQTPVVPPAPKLVPIAPPFIPPADAGTKPVPVPVPAPIPPSTAAPLPPSPLVPVGGTQFGAAVPPKPPATGPDEFDPSGFNQQPPK